MDIKEFENKRWDSLDQTEVFRHKAALELLGNKKKNIKVLDYGCGDGYFLELLKKNNISGVGVDISEKGVSKCRKKGFNAYILNKDEENNYKSNSYDYVVALDVLEHVYNPEDIIKKMINLSSRYIIIGVPNFNSLPARLQVFFGKVPENNRPNKGHVFWFNYKVLKKIIEENNLKIVGIKINTFWENKLLIGKIMTFFVKFFPSIFALSFVINVEKVK